MDDIQAMIRYSGRIRYFAIERMHFTIILTHFLSKDEQRAITENNYHTHPIGLEGKKKYYEYLGQVLPILQKKIGFQAIFSGNFGYVQQQELMQLCKDSNIPFIVFHKEGLIAGFFEGANEMYQGRKFVGDRLLIYNEKITRALLDKVSELTPEKIRLVGVPRLDRYKEPFYIPRRAQIVFFSFYIKNWMPKIIHDEKKYEAAEERALSFHRWILNFAKKHPEFDVILKTKAADFYLEYAKKIFADPSLLKLPNLTVRNYGDPVELIKQSRAVLGYNSMALIEALIAGKPIFSPFFGDLAGPGKAWDYFSNYPELINYIKTEDDLEMLLDLERFTPHDQKLVTEFVEQFAYRPDGQASFRAEQEVINVIEEYANAG